MAIAISPAFPFRRRHHDLPIPHFPRLFLVRGKVGERPAYPRAGRRPDLRCRHHRRRLHRPFGGGASRQGRHVGHADRGAPLRRRRVGPQWRATRHRPARLAPKNWRPNSAFTRAKALFDLAEEAKAHLLEFASVNGIDIDFMRAASCRSAHKQRYVDDYRKHADIMAERFGYPHISFMDAAETARAARLRRLFRRHARYRHRPYPSAQTGGRDGTGRGRRRRGAVREHAIDRHHVERRQGADRHGQAA